MRECTPQTPKRPVAAPREAVWVGGADGGAFVKCSVVQERTYRVCSIYDDHGGGLLAQGRFVVSHEHGGALDGTLLGWDGSLLLLVGGGALILETSQH